MRSRRTIRRFAWSARPAIRFSAKVESSTTFVGRRQRAGSGCSPSWRAFPGRSQPCSERSRHVSAAAELPSESAAEIRPAPRRIITSSSDMATQDAPPGGFRLGEWYVDPAQCRLSSHGRTIQVRARVMDLLVRLAATPGQVLSKETLLDEVWGSDAVSESALTRTVTELRQALGDNAD